MWLNEIKEERKSIASKRSSLEYQKSVLKRRIELLNQIESKLKTHLPKKYNEKLYQAEFELEHLKRVDHDLSLIEISITSTFELSLKD